MSSKMFARKLRKYLGAGLFSLASALSLNSQAADVDLLMVYDDHSGNHFGWQVDTAMRSWVSQINQIYQNSGIDITLHLVGTMHRNIAGADMIGVLSNLRVDAEVAKRRDETGADFVSMLTRTAVNGLCGRGYAAPVEHYAFSAVGPQCGAQTFAHEIGHNMGLLHSRRQGDEGGTEYRYGLGHGVDNAFATTMAYPFLFSTNWVPAFSNPRALCNGFACGVPAGNAQEADASLAINNVRDKVASFRDRPAGPTGYMVRAKHSGKCLDVGGWSTDNGANILQWDCHGGANQLFRVLDAGDGYWALQNVHSGKCIDVSGVGTHAGANIHQWDCLGADNQRVKAANLGNGTYQMAFRHSGICIDVANGNNGSNVYQHTCHNGQNQRFTFEAR